MGFDGKDLRIISSLYSACVRVRSMNDFGNKGILGMHASSMLFNLYAENVFSNLQNIEIVIKVDRPIINNIRYMNDAALLIAGNLQDLRR